MLRGKKGHFERDHFESHKGVAPAYLCELVVHCLELVSQLAHRDLDFRFKGGNSLLVLLQDPQRFSIDVDIVTTTSKEALTAMVEDIVASGPLFSKYEVRQHKTKPWLPMISYKLFFSSHYQPAEEAYVMLDAVLEPPPYPGIGGKRVACGALYDSDHQVELPSISGLIADKLLCIGPSTMGIPLGKKKEAQRLKHVFDVALLSREDHDEAAVRAALVSCMEQENRIQKSSHGLGDVASDTKRFLGEALAHDQRPEPEGIESDSYLGEIVRGFGEFRTFLFKTEYTWLRFRDDCRRVHDLVERLER